MMEEEQSTSRDPVDEASLESFPASDPPAWIPVHPGAPIEKLLETDPGARAVWNEALERAACMVDHEKGKEGPDQLSRNIRRLKRRE